MPIKPIQLWSQNSKLTSIDPNPCCACITDGGGNQKISKRTRHHEVLEEGREMGTRGKRTPAIQHDNKKGSSPKSMPVWQSGLSMGRVNEAGCCLQQATCVSGSRDVVFEWARCGLLWASIYQQKMCMRNRNPHALPFQRPISSLPIPNSDPTHVNPSCETLSQILFNSVVASSRLWLS